jgi:L-fuculose-phosphate aldolase
VSEASLREQVCEVGRWLYARGLVAAFDGNLSCRLDDGTVLCTPTTMCKGRMAPADLCVVTLEGEKLRGDRARTSEILLHLEIYKHAPAAKAVVHCHAPHVVAFAMTGTPIPRGILPEVEVFLGDVPTTPYETPGTAAFARTIVPVLGRTQIAVLSNHGVVSWDATLERAYWWTEILDAYCRVLLLSRTLGEPRRLPPDKIAELKALRDSLPSRPNAG